MKSEFCSVILEYKTIVVFKAITRIIVLTIIVVMANTYQDFPLCLKETLLIILT